MVFVLANCLASHLVVGTPLQAAARRRRACWPPGAAVRAASTARSSSTAGCSRSSRRSPPARSISASRWACGRCPGGDVHAGLADVADRRAARRRAGDAAGAARGGRCWSGCRSAARSSAAPRYAIGSSESGGLHVRRADRPHQARGLHARRPAGRDRRPAADLRHLFRRGVGGDRRRLHAELDRRRGHRRHLARPAARAAPSARSSAPSCCAPSATCSSCSTSSRCWQPLFQGVILLAAVSLGALRLLQVDNRLDLFR